jgi:UPF0755 protein
MDKIYKNIDGDLSSLSSKEKEEILDKLRDEIDQIDKRIVDQLNERTLFSIMIGRIKRSIGLPTYAPEREKEIAEKINSYAKEPLSKEALQRIYERIIDESRAVQKEEAEGKVFKIPRNKMKLRFKDLLNKKEFFIILVFFVVVFSVFYYTFFTPNHYKGKSPFQFEIRKGESLSEVAVRLSDSGIIPSKINFKFAGFIYGADKRIRAGRYKIPNDLNYFNLLDLFISGDADFLRPVNIRDGLSVKWLAYTLKREVYTDSSRLVNLASDRNFINSLGLKVNSLQGYLLTGKAEIYERSPAEEVIGILYGNFRDFMVDSLKQRADDLGFSIHEILTLASIIKGETNNAEEMSTISGVYHNRLRIGMKLQADPTIQYLQQQGWKRLSYRDLQIDSRYNTYKYFGLPPGPINNPGKSAILAALYPEENKYLFFVADGKGGHKFSKTYSEHLRNVNEYRKWLDTQNKN